MSGACFAKEMSAADGVPATFSAHGTIRGARGPKTVVVELDGKRVVSREIPAEVEGRFAVEVALVPAKDGARDAFLCITGNVSQSASALLLAAERIGFDPGQSFTVTIRPFLPDTGDSIRFD